MLSINQALGASTSLALTALSQSYWGRAGHDRTFQLSLGWRIGRASLGFMLTRNLSATGALADTRGAVTLSMPLGQEASWSTNSQITRDSRMGTSLQVGASGTAGEENQYGINVSDTRSASGNTVSLGGSYRGNAMMLSGNLSRGPASTQTSISADGGVVVHAGGVTFSNSLGDAVGLVYAPSAPGASVVGAPGSEVNRDGYAVVPYLTPYNLNHVELDLKNTSTDTQMDTTVEEAVPRSGAVVLIGFKGRRGRNVLIEARGADGSPLPFSATVTDESGRAVGLVGQGSRIEANVADDSGQLTVRWGEEPTDQCTLSYRLPPASADKAVSFTRAEALCVHPQRTIVSETPRKTDDTQ